MEFVKVEEPKMMSDERPKPPDGVAPVFKADITFIDAIFDKLLSYPVTDLNTFLDQNPEIIDYRAWHGITLLHKLCLRGELATIMSTLEHGADPNARTEAGETPVHYACRKGRLPSVMVLLKCGGDPAVLDNRGHNSMHFAAQGNAINVLVFLHETADLDYNGLSSALQTPLHVAALHGHWPTATFLLRNQKCDVNKVDIMGNTALHLAAYKGHVNICWQIVAHGGAKCLAITNNDRQTPADFAKTNTTSLRHADTFYWVDKFSKQYSTSGMVAPPRVSLAASFLFPITIGCIVPLILGWAFREFHLLICVACVGTLFLWTVRQNHRLVHPCRWPNPARAGVLLWGLMGNLISYFYFIKPYLYDHWMITWFSWTSLFAFLLSTGTFLRVNPGRFLFEDVPYKQRHDGKSIRDWNVVVQQSVNNNFCDECELVQPEGVRHCRMCGACYWNMDHHCLFLMRCVTRSNAKYFLFFLLSMLSGCLAYGINLYIYVSLLKRTSETSSTGNILWQLTTSQPLLFVILAADFFGITWCSVLAIHTVRVAKGKHNHDHCIASHTKYTV